MSFAGLGTFLLTKEETHKKREGGSSRWVASPQPSSLCNPYSIHMGHPVEQ